MAVKTSQNHSRLLFYGLIRLRLRNSGLRPSDSLDVVGSFRLIKSRKRSLVLLQFFPAITYFVSLCSNRKQELLSFTFFSFPVFAYSNC